MEVVKEETRVNIDILGISELRWTGMGEFNSDDHYIYYCRQESFRRNGVAIMVNESKMQYLEASLFVSKANHLYHRYPSLYPTSRPKKLKLNSFMKTYKTF